MELMEIHESFGKSQFEVKADFEKIKRTRNIAKPIAIIILAGPLIVLGLLGLMGVIYFGDATWLAGVLLGGGVLLAVWLFFRHANIHQAIIYEKGVVVTNKDGYHEIDYDSLSLAHYKDDCINTLHIYKMDGISIKKHIELTFALLPNFDEFTATLLALHTKYIINDLTMDSLKNKKFVFGVLALSEAKLILENGIFVNESKHQRKMPDSFTFDDITEVKIEKKDTYEETSDVLCFMGVNEKGKSIKLAALDTHEIVNLPILTAILSLSSITINY